MATLLAPGVRYERVDASAPRVGAVRMDVAGFVGLAERGPLDEPVPVQSWRQFEARFGGFTGPGLLPYAVRAFFENGGRRCWVVRVASRDPAGGAAEASAEFGLDGGGAGWRVSAASPGSWGNALVAVLRETHAAQTVAERAFETPAATAVASVDGFARYTAVRISQEGAPPVHRVVSGVDPDARRLLWVHPDPAARTRYDTPLAGLDPGRPALVESVEYTLLVHAGGRLVRSYARLSSVPEHPRYGPHVVAVPDAERSPDERRPTSTGRPADLDGRLPSPPEPVRIDELRPLPLTDWVRFDVDGEAARTLAGGASGLALLRPDDFMGEPSDPRDPPPVRAAKARGFRALDAVAEVTSVALPDLHVKPLPAPPVAPPPPCDVDPCIPETAPPAVATPVVVEPEQPPALSLDEVVRVQTALVDHCAGRADRLALLDPPRAASTDPREGESAVRAWRRRFASSYAVVYWPWLGVVDPLRRVPTVEVPPSGHVAGQFARTDFAVGVHRAPANFALDWAHDVTLAADETTHGVLNAEGINVVRALPARGIRLMGARTLHPDGGPLRFVNVRRLLMMVRAALYNATQWAVFEPNDYLTRAKVQLAVGGFLQALWRRGGLAGDTADEAFRVRCDEENNPPHERANGRLLAEVALAPVHPMEFVIVRVGRTDDEIEITEPAVSRGGA